MVADGRLTAEEAEPILAALDAAGSAEREAAEATGPDASTGSDRTAPGWAGRSIRVEVTEDGRPVVKLRLPASLGNLSLDAVPGLSGATIERIRAAMAAGARGPVFEALDETGDGVRIVLD